VVNDLSIGNKFSSFINGDNIDNYNLFLNSQMVFDQPVSGNIESWCNLKRAFPAVKHSAWFDNAFAKWKNVLVVPLQSAPSDFQKSIQSGQNTSSHNTDVLLQIGFKALPTAQIRADSYLLSDVVLYMDSTNGGDLKVRY